MRFDRDRFSEIASATLTTLKKRPRLVFLGACLLVVAISFIGTQFFADRLLSSLPDKKGPIAPLPMTEQEIQDQVRTAQELNEQLRSQRAAERAYAMQQAQELRDSLGGAGSEYGAGAIDPAPPAYAGPGAGPGGRVPRPTDFVATDEPAEPVYTAKAEYPELARQSGTEGTVVIQALVGTDGRVHDTRILKSIPILNEAAESAVRRWRFRPAQSEGTPVATWVSVPVTFRR
jgi:TonB family protein